MHYNGVYEKASCPSEMLGRIPTTPVRATNDRCRQAFKKKSTTKNKSN
jgi:hypothetical protein